MIYLLIFLFVTALFIMFPSRRTALIITAVFISLITVATSWLAISVLFTPDGTIVHLPVFFPEILSKIVICDKLSAFFILIINFTVISGFIYSTGYLKPYLTLKPASWIKLHYLSLVWLHASMVLVLLFRDGFRFLMVWEIMTLSSFILVIFDYDVKGTLKAGINYLIQMHAGMLFILGAFVMSAAGSENLTFDNLGAYFKINPNWPVFALFFIGFGLKAGFFFLHTWLPDAHPAAPSHVSGIMSGVMIKLGIYGILRVTVSLQDDLYAIGASVIIISAVTGLFGVMMAILQHDVKKLLAYHSIENIGIIGLGIGLGIYGTSVGNVVVSAAGYAGALLHTLNHSLFKSLLFYSAGSAIGQVHTRNIERMGGLMKFMPLTAWAFLIGAIAISGLPPFNGFISEFLIYSSIFNGFSKPEFYPLIIFFLAMLSLVLIGGLALLCFTKVFSVIFLGQPRVNYPEPPAEARKVMLIAKLLPVIPIIFIGLFPFLIIKPLMELTGTIFPYAGNLAAVDFSYSFRYLSAGSILLFAIVLMVIVIRRIAVNKKSILTGPTWGCGYTAVDSKQQYTATSFIQEYSELTKPIIKTGASNIDFKDDEIFPGERDFHTHSDDAIRSKIINRPADFIINILRRAAVFQTGKLQHYVLYALLFLVLIFLLTYLKLI